MNKYKPNLQILCEDEINQDIARGFLLGFHGFELQNPSPIEVCKDVTRGWKKAENQLRDEWVDKLKDNENLFLLILIDSDKRDGRIKEIRNEIPDIIKDRVFVIGCFSEPEVLKQQAHEAIKEAKMKVSSEAVGKVLFQHCKDNPPNNLWGLNELNHNSDEILRLKQNTSSFINWEF